MKFHVIVRVTADEVLPEYDVNVTPEGVILKHIASGAELTITKDTVAAARNAMVVHWSAVYGFVTSANEDLINDKGQFAYLQYARNVEKNVCAVVGNDKYAPTEAALVFSDEVTCNIDVVRTSVEGPTAAALNEVFPGILDRRMKFRNAKIDLLSRTNAHDSIAALEKQVDLLSAMVVSLAEKQPVDEQPTWLAEFKAGLEAHSAVQFKGDVGALQEVVAVKAAMREAQQKYFDARGY